MINTPLCQIPISWPQYLLFQLINFPLLFDLTPLPFSSSVFYKLQLFSSKCISPHINKPLRPDELAPNTCSGFTLLPLCFRWVSVSPVYRPFSHIEQAFFFFFQRPTDGCVCPGTASSYLCKHERVGNPYFFILAPDGMFPKSYR